MKTKTLYLKTTSGQQIYSTGRMQFSLTKGVQQLSNGYNGDFSHPVYRTTDTYSVVQRASFLAKVQAKIGEPLVWVEGPQVESFSL